MLFSVTIQNVIYCKCNLIYAKSRYHKEFKQPCGKKNRKRQMYVKWNK